MKGEMITGVENLHAWASRQPSSRLPQSCVRVPRSQLHTWPLDGYVYMLVTANLIKIGSTGNLAARFQTHFKAGPIAGSQFSHAIVSPRTVRYRELEQRIHGLCGSAGVPRFGPIFSPLDECYVPDHPIFELLGNMLRGEIYLRGLTELLLDNPTLRVPRLRKVTSNAPGACDETEAVAQPPPTPLHRPVVPFREWSTRQWHAIMAARYHRAFAI